MSDDDLGHASSLPAQLRQAERDGDLPESTADHSMIRLHVDGEPLSANNPIDYLVLLLLEARRYDGAYDGDDELVARWAVAQWCQELGWAPDLTAYNAGEQVDRGDEIPCCNEAFYPRAGGSEGDDE